MQTSIWMAYSDSMHFSDKFSYKILFILSYGLKDINLARFKYLQEFSEEKNRNWAGPDRKRRRIENCRVGHETAVNNVGPRPIWRQI
jgi:hypothetical protein